MLYATAAHLGLRLLAPRVAPRWSALAAITFCLGIVVFKFTDLPEAWSSHVGSRLIFGTTPSWHNVICYIIGVGVVACVDMLVVGMSAAARPAQ